MKAKNKAIICSVLLYIIMFAVLLATYLIKSSYGFSLYDVISPCIVGSWMYIMTARFYHWLMK